MTISELISQGGAVLFILASLVQISPIKINPWSWLGKKIGKAINGDMHSKIDELSSQVTHMQENNARREADNYRARILRFGDEILGGRKHSKEHFDQTLLDITAYDLYCSEHPEFSNHVTTIASNRIKEVYSECLKNNTFI